MSSERRRGWLSIAVLVLTGVLLSPIVRQIRRDQTSGPAAASARIGGGGPAIAVAALGGFRALAADIAWLNAYGRWEQRDPAGTMAWLHLATTLDARPLAFWLNGARILAYDMPAWRIGAEQRDGTLTDQRRRRIVAEQLERTRAWLGRAEAAHPGHPAILIERAGIELTVARDVAAAAEDYRRAAGLPGAPYFAARLHAELLRRLGRKAEALAWLERIHPGLPPEDPAAEADIVLGRIRELEDELHVPAGQRYPGLR